MPLEPSFCVNIFALKWLAIMFYNWVWVIILIYNLNVYMNEVHSYLICLEICILWFWRAWYINSNEIKVLKVQKVKRTNKPKLWKKMSDFDGIDNKASWDLISTRPLQKSSNSLYSNGCVVRYNCIPTVCIFFFLMSALHSLVQHNRLAQLLL